jgi:hypothetical protein
MKVLDVRIKNKLGRIISGSELKVREKTQHVKRKRHTTET